MKKIFLILCYGITILAPYAQTAPLTLAQKHEIYSEELSEKRILNIYSPPAIENDTNHYPVIYVLDGSWHEDFIHITGLVQFLCMYQILEPSIVVGIENVDRKRDFTYPTTIEQDKKDFPTTGGSEKFIRFLEKEVQPYVNKNYPVQKQQTLIGQSLGGLLATEILFKKPSLFNRYIIVSPSLWWDKESLLKYPALDPVNAGVTHICVAVGKEHPIMIKDARKLYSMVKKYGAKGIKTHFDYLANEDHATILHEAVYRAFKSMTAKNK